MGGIIVAFVAGILTVLAPCVFPMLPIIIGSSVSTRKLLKPAVIITSLSLTILLITLLLKFGEESIFDIPERTLWYISGFVLVFIGVVLVFPNVWDKISYKLRLSVKSNQLLQESSQKKGLLGDVLTGVALGPVFTSCSPTYFIILNISLNESISTAFVYLIFYILGLATIMMVVAFYGQQAVRSFKWATNPHGLFKKIIGLIFMITGVVVFLGLHHEIQNTVIQLDIYRILQDFEMGLTRGQF